MTSDKKVKGMIQRIYVLNTSAKLLSIQIDTMAGKEFSVTIPNTWIPVDLTDQAKFRDIIESPSFNRAERLGKIKILDTAEAEQILSTKDAKLERNRLDSGVFNVVEIEENPASDTVDYDSEDYTNRNLIVSAVDEPAAINQFRIIQNRKQLTPSLVEMMVEICDEKNWKNLFQHLSEFQNKDSGEENKQDSENESGELKDSLESKSE